MIPLNRTDLPVVPNLQHLAQHSAVATGKSLRALKRPFQEPETG